MWEVTEVAAEGAFVNSPADLTSRLALWGNVIFQFHSYSCGRSWRRWPEGVVVAIRDSSLATMQFGSKLPGCQLVCKPSLVSRTLTMPLYPIWLVALVFLGADLLNPRS